MQIIKHMRNGEIRRYEIVNDQFSLFVTPNQLFTQRLFIRAALRQSLRNEDPAGHSRAFRPLTTPMGRREWDTTLNGLLATIQTAED
jgi:hypothetical protein